MPIKNLYTLVFPKWIMIFYFFIVTYNCYSNGFYDKYFTNRQMRVDFYLKGNYNEYELIWDNVKNEPFWGGSKKLLVDTTFYGDYFFKVLDFKSRDLLYSCGFCSLFREWQNMAEAINTISSFEQTIIFPFPKNKIILEVFARNDKNEFEILNFRVINPNKAKKSMDRLDCEIVDVLVNGNPENRVDFVFLAEGYKKDHGDKFIRDVEILTDTLFAFSPYKEHQMCFNIKAINIFPEEYRAKVKNQSQSTNTPLNASFNTFGNQCYLSTESNFKVRDYASLVPYDQIIILVNSMQYGGGGIYNHYNIVTSDHTNSYFVLLHELSHGFAGLADEYFSSSTTYSNYYNLDVEPWEPNITTLVDFKSKWEYLVGENIPVPTPLNPKYHDKTGVFEGAGYVANGMYRPCNNCMMKSYVAMEFCPVCTQIITGRIFYSCE